jgi:hypothetical protein
MGNGAGVSDNGDYVAVQERTRVATPPGVGRPGDALEHTDSPGALAAQALAVKRRGSLRHLASMMEVEQALRVRLPADALSHIQSYEDLEKAVRANLPTQMKDLS